MNWFQKIKEDKKYRFEFLVQLWTVLVVIVVVGVSVMIGFAVNDPAIMDAEGTESVIQKELPSSEPEEDEIDVSSLLGEEADNIEAATIASKKNKSDESSGDEDGVNSKIEKVRYTTTVVNLRSGPSIASEVLVKLSANEEVTFVKKIDDEWSKVIYQDQAGYITSIYLTKDKPDTLAAATPVPNITTPAPADEPIIQTPKPTNKPKKTPKPERTLKPEKTPKPKKTSKPEETPKPTIPPNTEEPKPTTDPTEGPGHEANG